MRCLSGVIAPSVRAVDDRHVTNKVWFTTREAAELLGYRSRDSVVRLIHSGELRAYRRGRSWRIPRSELHRLSQPPNDDLADGAG